MQSVMFAAALFLAAQSTPQFSGTWIAAHAGDTFVRLELHEINGALGGRISLGAMHVDKDGVVDEVNSPAVNFTPIFDVVLRDGVLSFARKDGDDTDRFEMRLTDGVAGLTFVLTAEDRAALAREGVPLPKPVRLTKAPQ